MSLADYLAKNYLTADSKPNKKAKKRKRKDDPQAGLVIADDDALGWNPAGDGHADDDAPITGKSIFSNLYSLADYQILSSSLNLILSQRQQCGVS